MGKGVNMYREGVAWLNNQKGEREGKPSDYSDQWW